MLAYDTYPELHKKSAIYAICFGNICICMQIFSLVKMNKSKPCNCLSDDSLHFGMRMATSKARTGFKSHFQVFRVGLASNAFFLLYSKQMLSLSLMKQYKCTIILYNCNKNLKSKFRLFLHVGGYVADIDVFKWLLPVLQVLWKSHSHVSMTLYPSCKSLLKRNICYPEHMLHVNIVILLLFCIWSTFSLLGAV